MPFQPGNKYGKGRPTVGKALATAVRDALTPAEWVERVLELLGKATDERVRLGCLQLLADRGWGKPKETIELKSELTEDEYREELAIIAREHLDSLPPEERLKLLSDPAPSDTIQ